MNKHYSANYRLNAERFNDEELPIPVWVWPVAMVVILLVLVVR